MEKRVRRLLYALLIAGFAAVMAAMSASAAAQIKLEGKGYYLYDTTTGQKVTGLKGKKEYPEGSGDYYYFKNKKGLVYRKAWIKKGSSQYRAGLDGKLYSGLTKVGKKYYYFNTKTLLKVTGWKKFDGGFHYFNNKGVMQFGFITVKKQTYYLDPDNSGIRATGWKTISGKKYYFNAKGRMAKGFCTIDGKKYYMNAKGGMKTGLATINGKKYYFDPTTGVMQTGWVTTPKKQKTYYFNSKGEAVTGWMTLDGKKYFFSNKGIMQKGWLTQAGKKYYLDPSTGAMVTGKQTIDGKSYDFGTKGYIVVEVTGAWSIKVNQGTCVVTVYRGNTAIKAMLCSVGLNGATPNGTFKLGVKRHWHALYGGVYGQYTSLITGNILFHSVYYYTYRNPNTLSTAEYNKLGSPASAGCVRLNCADAYYIYHNVPVGTPVTIFKGTASDDPLPRPAKLTITTNYDPTDPYPND